MSASSSAPPWGTKHTPWYRRIFNLGPWLVYLVLAGFVMVSVACLALKPLGGPLQVVGAKVVLWGTVILSSWFLALMDLFLGPIMLVLAVAYLSCTTLLSYLVAPHFHRQVIFVTATFTAAAVVTSAFMWLVGWGKGKIPRYKYFVPGWTTYVIAYIFALSATLLVYSFRSLHASDLRDLLDSSLSIHNNLGYQSGETLKDDTLFPAGLMGLIGGSLGHVAIRFALR